MWRRCLLAVVMALGSMPGCGFTRSVLMMGQPHGRGVVSRTYNTSVNRVILAALDSTGIEFSPATPGFAFPMESALSIKGEVKPVGEVPAAEIAEVNFGSGSMVGKTQDGRPVTLWIRSIDEGKKAEATIRVGQRGDTNISREYLDWVSDWLDQPSRDTEDGTRKGKLLIGKTLGESSKKDASGVGVDPKKASVSGPGGTDR